MTAKKKVPQRIVIDTKKKPRKPNPSKTKFSRENPSPTQFVPGQSGNPGGKPRTDRLLSKALNVALGDKAPREACDLVQIPFGASWAMVLARRILRLAMTQDWGIAAMREIREATEGSRGRLDVFGGHGGDEEAPPVMTLAFIDANGEGRPCDRDLAVFPDLAKTIEGKSARPALPSPQD